MFPPPPLFFFLSVQRRYRVLVGETPDPSSHLHSEDEEKEEEELTNTTEARARFNAQNHLPDFNKVHFLQK